MTFIEQSELVEMTPEAEAGQLASRARQAHDDVAAAGTAVGEAAIFRTAIPAAIGAYRLGQPGAARSYALLALQMAPAHRTEWNYGNAIHFAHTTLGLLACDEGNIDAALHHLHAAGATPGSPQLNSFGPTMQLAKALLRLGQAAPVLAYFEQCAVFWTSGGDWLPLWTAKIADGKVPNFVFHVYR